MPAKGMLRTFRSNQLILPLFDPYAGSGYTKENVPLTETNVTTDIKCRGQLFAQFYGKCKSACPIGRAYVNMFQYKNDIIKILQTLCLSICAFLPFLALHLIGYVAIGGWDTYWAKGIWMVLYFQMLFYGGWLFVILLRQIGGFGIIKAQPIPWKLHCTCYLLITLILLLLAFGVEEMVRMQQRPLTCNFFLIYFPLTYGTLFLLYSTETLLSYFYGTNE